MSVEIPGIKPDCRHYNGYKPCKFCDDCGNCQQYEPCGTRILVIKLAAAGDVIRTTPILEPLRRQEGPCHITWLTDPVAMDLLKETSEIDRLLAWSWENCLILQGLEFDLLLNFDKEPRAQSLAALIPAGRKMGFCSTPTGRTFIYNPEAEYALRLGLSDELKFRQNEKSATEIVFEMIGLPYQGEEYQMGLSQKARSFAQDLAARNHLTGEQTVIGINTGCGEAFATKQWSAEGFIGLIEGLLQRGAGKIVLLGGPREEDFNRALLVRFGAEVINGRTDNTVEQFMGIVNLCDLVVTADTMAMHIAIGLKKEVVALFGPTCHQEVDLFGRGEKIVSDFACSPCYLKSCSKNPTCMMALQADTVLEAVERRLKALHPRAGVPIQP